MSRTKGMVFDWGWLALLTHTTGWCLWVGNVLKISWMKDRYAIFTERGGEVRTKSRKDLNQTAIVKELRELGFDCDIVERPFDLVVSGWKTHVVVLGLFQTMETDVECSLRVELKSEKGKLSDSQQEYFNKQKHKGSIIVAYNVEDITDWFGG